MKKLISFLFFLLSLHLDGKAQTITNQNSLQNVLKKVQQQYASYKNSEIKYHFYQKISGKYDTIPYHIEAIHHAKIGKLSLCLYDHSVLPEAPFHKSQILRKTQNARKLYSLSHNGKGNIYGEMHIKYSIFRRIYQHLPTENPNSFFKVIGKTAQDMQETNDHYTIKSENYTLKINKQYEVEEITYNNQKSDIDNIHEHLVITYQKHNQPHLDNLTLYDIKLPKRYNEASYFARDKLTKDTLAPAWACADITSDRILKLDEFKGKVVVLDFWNTTCKPCIEFLPKMKELQTEYKNKDVVFIGMAYDKNKENIIKHLEKYAGGVFYTNVLYTEKDYEAYKVYSVPTFFVIDKEQKITYLQEGTKNAKENLRTHIQKALDEK